MMFTDPKREQGSQKAKKPASTPLVEPHSSTAVSAEIGFSIATPLASRALFWRAQYLAPSSFAGHLPLLYWLVDVVRPSVSVELGTRDGVAYFGMCQSVQRLNLPAFCHSLRDAPEAADDPLEAYNAEHFDDISDLFYGPVIQSLQRFAPGTIDMALVDVEGLSGPQARISAALQERMSEGGLIVLYNLPDGVDLHSPKALIPTIPESTSALVIGTKNPVVILVQDHDATPPVLKRFAQLPTGGMHFNAVIQVFNRLGRLHELEQKLSQSQGAEASLATLQAQYDAAVVEVQDLKAKRDVDIRTVEEAQTTTRTLQAQIHAQARFKREAEETARALVGLQEDLHETKRTHESVVETLKQQLADAQEEKAAEGTQMSERLNLQVQEVEKLRTTVTELQSEHEIELQELKKKLKSAKAAHETALAAKSAQPEAPKVPVTPTAPVVEDTQVVEALETKLAASREAHYRETAALTKLLEDHKAELEAAHQSAQEALVQKTQLEQDLTELASEIAELRAYNTAQAVDDTELVQAQAENHQLKEKMAFDAAYRNAQLRLRELQVDRLRARDKSHKALAKDLRQSPHFNGEWYLEAYPDVAEAKMDPADHFARSGWFEGRNAAPGLDTITYYIEHPDALEEGLCPPMHMERMGR